MDLLCLAGEIFSITELNTINSRTQRVGEQFLYRSKLRPDYWILNKADGSQEQRTWIHETCETFEILLPPEIPGGARNKQSPGLLGWSLHRSIC